jgi:hypothetical protein
MLREVMGATNLSAVFDLYESEAQAVESCLGL